jgi:hypothetical protein
MYVYTYTGKMVAEAIAARDESRAVRDVSSVLTIAQRDWPKIVRNIS